MIGATVAASMEAALVALETDAYNAEAAAPGLVADAWAWVISAESAADGARELARKAREDADRFRARYVALMASATATDADGEAFVADAESSYGGGQASRIVGEAAHLLSPVTALVETAKGTAADLAAGVKGAIEWGKYIVPIVLIAVAGLAIRDVMAEFDDATPRTPEEEAARRINRRALGRGERR